MEPYWSQVSTLLEVDRNARAQIMMSGGVDQLLSTLHPAIRWRPPVLEVPGTGHDIKLESTGLEIAPSLFLFSRSPILVEQQGDRPLLLLYPIPVPRERENLWDPAPDGEQALGALLGRTRAAVLQVLTTTCTTTEVGELVGISTAAASQHTAVLRAAGLITTLRSLNKVHHTLTPWAGRFSVGIHWSDNSPYTDDSRSNEPATHCYARSGSDTDGLGKCTIHTDAGSMA